MYFYGGFREFSTKNEEQYKAIGEFWDAWMDEELEVKGLLFDTAKCTAYYRPKEPDHIVLISNFMYTSNSSIHWWDEASYGMCTHPCTKEESRKLYQILKDTTLDQWHFTGGIKYVRVTEKIRKKALELLWKYLQSEKE